MDLIKEDGTGLATSNTYGLPADIDPYAELYNWTFWLNLEDVPARESACARATMFLELFPNIFESFSEAQALTFPLKIHEALPAESRIPKTILLAHAIAANLEAENPGVLLKLKTDKTQAVKIKELKNVNKKEFFQNKKRDLYPFDESPIIFNLMKIYLPQEIVSAMRGKATFTTERFYK